MGALFACFRKLFRLLKVFCCLEFSFWIWGSWSGCRSAPSLSGGAGRRHIRLSCGTWGVSSRQVIHHGSIQDTAAGVLSYRCWLRSSSNESSMKNSLLKDKGNISHLLFRYVVLGMGTLHSEQNVANFSHDLYQEVQNQWAAYSRRNASQVACELHSQMASAAQGLFQSHTHSLFINLKFCLTFL